MKIKSSSRRRKMSSKWASFWCGIIGVVMIIVSIVVYSVNIGEYVYAKNARENGDVVYASCTSKWSETETTRSKTGTKNHRKTKTTTHTYYYANAKYNYQDNVYECHKLSVSSSTKVGDAIKIYVLPEHPEKYVQDGTETISLLTIITFSFLPLLGISCLSVPISNARRKRRYGITSNTVSQNVSNNSYNYNNNMNNSNNPNNTYSGYDNNISNNNHW